MKSSGKGTLKNLDKKKEIINVPDTFIDEFVKTIEPKKPFLKKLTIELKNKFGLKYEKQYNLYSKILQKIIIELRTKYPLTSDICPFNEESIFDDILNINNICPLLKNDVKNHFDFFISESNSLICSKYRNKTDIKKLIYSFVLNVYWFTYFSDNLKRLYK